MARYAFPRFFLLCASLLIFVMSGCGNKSNNNDGSASCSTRDDCAAGERCSTDGLCTTEPAPCEYNSECGVDEYCANGLCELRACVDDDGCVDGSICLAEQCVVGCREDGDCDDGEACSSTNICEVAGCTTSSCPPFQSCDDAATPPACVYTGDCANDAHCAGYAQLVDDGNEYICSQAEQRCVIKPPCDGDADCQVGDICEPRATDGRRVCRSGCRGNDACRSGYICDLNNLACAPGCASVADCPSDGATYACEDFVCIATCETRNECGTGQVCVGSPRRCQACSDDAECPANEFCNKELGSTDQEIENSAIGLCAALPPTCPDDGYGNNHNQNVAFPVTTPFDTASEQPLFCRENSGGEWFSFSAASGDVIEVRLNYDNSLGNLDIGLRREASEELVASQNPPTIDQGEELIRFGVDLGGTFLVHVRGTLISANANYDLTIDVNPAPACTDDALEPNSASSPAVLPVDTDHLGLEACGDDPDFYTLNIAQNQIVTINVESPIALGNVDIYLRDPDGVQVASSTTRMDKDTIEVALGDAGAFVLEVRSGVGAVKYDLAWTQRDNNCADPFEPNDMCPSNPIASGTYEGLNVCADNDWYSVELLPLQTVTVTATYDRAVSAGDLDLTLIGPNDCATLSAVGTETPIAGTTRVQERVQYQSESGGTYNIQVFLFSGVQAEYDLVVDVSDGPPCVDDAYEPNDNEASATLLDRAQLAAGTDNVLAGLRMCDTNDDWYRVDLEAGDEIEFQVQFEHARGDLDAELIGPNGVVATASTESDDELLSYTVGAGEAGAYYLKITAKFAARNDYWVLTFLNGAGPVDTACPDQFEDNDSRAEAAPITPGNYGLLVCGAPVDEDWFSIPMLAGERLELVIGTDGGDAEMFLFDDSGSTAPVGQATTSSAGTISYTSYRDQTMAIRVREAVGQARVPYNLAVTKFGVPPCVDDRFSGNTSSDLAAEVEIPGLYGRMMLCDGATDWYAIELTAGRSSEVFLNFDGTRADLDLAIYGPSMALVDSSDDTGNDESIEFVPQVSGTHYIEVTGKANARLNYDLLLYTDADGDGIPEGPEDRVCPDVFENNDTIATAVQVPPGTYEDLLICSPLDNDYYRVFVPAGATLTALVNFSNDLGNIDLELRNAAAPFALISESKTANDVETVELVNSGDDRFVIVGVLGATGAGVFSNYYELDLDLEFADMCVDDTHSGPTIPTAVTLTPGAYEMRMCEGTVDVIALGNISSVEAHIEFKHDFGDLDMALLDSGTSSVRSNGVGNTESIVESGLSGQHYLMIAPKGGAFIRNDYDLWLSIDGTEPAVPYCPDRFERNDTVALASAIPLGQTQRQVAGLIACGTEEDWYITSNLAGTTFDLAMFYDHGAGADLDIAMWPLSADPTTDTPTVFVDTAADDALSPVTLTSGQHYIRVRNTASNGVETPYDLLLGLASMYGAAGCPEDALEPNNNSSSAKSIGFPASLALGLCGNDDHFKFVVPRAGPVTVSIAFDASKFNAGLRVLDSSFNVVGFSFDDVGNRESVTFTAVAGGEYFIEVQQSGGTTENGPYFLRIQ